MENSLQYAQQQDQNDALASFRHEFLFPSDSHGNPVVYLCGNSLGLQPKGAENALKVELEDWAKFGVEGHFHGRKPWFHYHKFLTDYAAEVVGAQPIEVVVMNQLTVNLHLLFASFYRPNGPRYKIIMEAGAFPSDMYAVESQVIQYGYAYDDAVIELAPREGEHSLRNEDILAALEQHRDEIALVFFPGVQYYTGQYFDIEGITQKAHEIGALAGFDLAHAAGNIDLQLHQWGVDFAAWCSYKYLNSGPGNVSGIFIHETHSLDPSTFRLAGWWGHKEDVRFLMKRGYIPEPGAAGWQLSNAPVFGMAVHLASLELFHKAGMAQLRSKSKALTSYLEFVIQEAVSQNPDLHLSIITPESRGAQLSLLSDENGKSLFDFLESKGIVADWREPNVIRMAPVPMYNSFEDAYRVGQALLEFRK
ncbi:MAG: kynureninase [Bacteroidia bacterium]